MLTQRDKIAWLRLIRSKNIGPRTFWDLLQVHGSASVAVEMIPEMARRAGVAGRVLEPLSNIEKEIELTKKFGGTFIFEASDLYPFLLKNIDDRPPVLVARGKVDLLRQRHGIAIVGARNASANGSMMAAGLAEHLASAGYAIISGLARGVDAAAHKASLPNGTVGVIAGGINHIYPYENKNLFNMLYEQGVVVSEHPFNSSALPKYFPQRNRIISGMSLGVIVIEAAARSGTLITARYALDQGREVFVVPGSPMDLRYKGSNNLIKSGAHLVEDAEDVINIIGDMTVASSRLLDTISKAFTQPTAIFTKFDENELGKYRKILLEKLSFSPTALEDIAKYSEIPAQILNYLVVELELAGKAERLIGNKIVLIHEE